tara:strand:- start:707 stop:1597 length:891 start_codon:yes stop_codon:yes gene_type:complete
MGCCCTKSEPDAPAFDPVIGLSHKLKSGGVQVKGSTISGDGSLLGDSPVLQDKAYFEVTVVTPGTFAVGLATKETPLDGVLSQDKAATAWTLTSSLQALGPLEGGEVIGCALDQGDYPVQVRHRVPTAVVRRASMPRLAHTTHPLRRAGLLLPRRQGDPPDQRHPWRGVCRLQRLGRRSARGQLWRQGLCGRHTFWLPGTPLPRVASACPVPAARPLRMARGPCISIRTHARITSGNHQGDKHHVSVPPRCNTPGHHQGERLAVSGRRLAGRGPVSGSRSVRSQMIDAGGTSDGAS